jgi:cob(I)alamin adenosyltransferase
MKIFGWELIRSSELENLNNHRFKLIDNISKQGVENRLLKNHIKILEKDLRKYREKQRKIREVLK